MQRVQRQSYGAVVFHDDGDTIAYLLIQRKDTRNPFWGLPKGRPEDGESPLETAVRETKEEAGVGELTAVSEQALSEQYQFRDAARSELIEKTVDYFVMRAHERDCQPDGTEVSECAWLPYGQARERLEYDAAKAVLDKAHALVQKNL